MHYNKPYLFSQEFIKKRTQEGLSLALFYKSLSRLKEWAYTINISQINSFEKLVFFGEFTKSTALTRNVISKLAPSVKGFAFLSLVIILL